MEAIAVAEPLHNTLWHDVRCLQARREEAARLRTLAEEQGRQAAKEQQLYADEHQSFKLAFEFTTGLPRSCLTCPGCLLHRAVQPLHMT